MSLKYCGFCHTDVHLSNNDWKLPGFEYPAVVGHEIAGIVTKPTIAIIQNMGDLCKILIQNGRRFITHSPTISTKYNKHS